MLYKRRLTKEQAIQKLRHYCGYQERSHQEVREKLYALGVSKKEHDEIIALLIEENYLNEERFATAFARGKFRMNQWGRTRIVYELKQRKISDYCIKKALKQISEKDYLDTIEKLVEQKNSLLKGEPSAVRKKKTINYLVGKGYEMEEILKVISNRNHA